MPVLLKILILIFVILIMFLIHSLIVATILYRLLLVRTSKTKWSRDCGAMKNKEHEEMFLKGCKWAKEQDCFKQDVSICNEGLKLYGEFFNFGFDKAVIIISGRAEACKYSYYYAIPYKNLGYNVLVIDNRCTGLSDGKYLSFGIKEYKDILLWGQLLNQNYGVKSVVLHGICVGTATALFTLTSDNLPDYYKGMIADGMYTTFYDSFKNHIVEFKQLPFLVLQIVFFLVKHISKIDAKNNGPIYSIEKLNKPILFIHSKQDKFSLPKEIEKVYNKCNTQKKIVWFQKGKHSHIRINNENEYDLSIREFVETLQN